MADFGFGKARMTRLNSYVPAVVSAGLLLLAAFGTRPYSFYVFLRIVVCLIAIYSAVKAMEMNRIVWTWIMAGVAIVFNPVLPLRMHKSDWKIFNVISAGIFVAWMVVISLRKPKPSES